MPDDPTSEQALKAEFEILTARAGLAIPESRKAALLKGFKELKQMTARMHRPFTVAHEPAGTYDIRTVTRKA
jgi:RNase P/RNase MRP subunit p30